MLQRARGHPVVDAAQHRIYNVLQLSSCPGHSHDGQDIGESYQVYSVGNVHAQERVVGDVPQCGAQDGALRNAARLGSRGQFIAYK